MTPLRHNRLCPRAFTLIEMLIGTALGLLVVAGVMMTFTNFIWSWRTTTLMRNSSTFASMGIERLIYGVGTNPGLREASASTMAFTYVSNGWKVSYNTNLFFQYSPTTHLITDENGKIICSGVLTSSIVYLTNACQVSLTVTQSLGGKVRTNAMSSFVQFRNQ